MFKKFIIALVICISFSASGQMLLNESSLPEYEGKIDHERLILSHDKTVRQFGKTIYDSVCLNCHGDAKKAGSSSQCHEDSLLESFSTVKILMQCIEH